MSTRHPIHHHVRANTVRKWRRRFVDVLLIFILLSAVALLLVIEMRNTRLAQESRLREAQRAQEKALMLEQSLATDFSSEENQGLDDLEGEGRATSSGGMPTQISENENSSTDETSLIIDEDITEEEVVVPPPTVNTGYVTFDDVTVTRYQNSQLGFVMELPQGWSEVYARGTDALFASGSFPGNAILADIPKKPDMLWMHVVRPCTTTLATSSLFAFATSSNALSREATSCVPPFLITLSYGISTSTPNDFFGKERFLLSFARTFYPMVSAQAPYLPIR